MENAVSDASSAPQFESVPPKPVDIGAIEAELAALWGSAPRRPTPMR